MTRRTLPAPSGDPFWDVLLARRPDVDLVLLPPAHGAPRADDRADDGAGADAGPPVSAETVGDLSDALTAEVETILAESGSPGVPATHRVLPGRRAGLLRVRARAVSETSAPDALDAAAAALQARGWSITARPGRSGAALVGRLTARLAVTSARAVEARLTRTSATGMLQVEVAVDGLPVEAEVARALLRGEGS